MMRSSDELRDELRGAPEGPRRRALQAELLAALIDEDDDETCEERAGVTHDAIAVSSAADQVEFHLDVARHLEGTFGPSLAPLDAAAELLDRIEPPVRRVQLAHELVRGLARIRDRRAGAIAEDALAIGDRWLSAHPELCETLVALRLIVASDETSAARSDRAREALDLASESGIPDLVVQAANALADLLLPDDVEGAGAALERARASAVPPDTRQPSAHALRWVALANETRRARGAAEWLVEDLFADFHPSTAGEPLELAAGLELAKRFFTPTDGATEALVSGSLDDVESVSHGLVRAVEDFARLQGLRDLACYCGRYRGSAYCWMVCERCGAEVLSPEARLGRIGHLELKQPVVHPWYVQDVELLLGRRIGRLERGESLEDELSRALDDIDSNPIGPRARARSALFEALEHATYPTPNRPTCLLLRKLPVPTDATALGVRRSSMNEAYEAVLEASLDAEPRAVANLFAVLKQPHRTKPAPERREAVPTDVLCDIAWTLNATGLEETLDDFIEHVRETQEKVNGSTRWWRPHARALAAPRVRVRFRCWTGRGEETPMLELRTPNGSFTEAELMFAVVRGIAAYLTTGEATLHDYRFFEGLTLVSVDAGVPLYQVHQGS